MRIRARKISQILLIALTGTAAFAGDAPSAPAATSSTQPGSSANGLQPQPAPAAPASNQAGSGTSSSTSTALDYLYNHKAQEGTVADQASQANEAAKNRAIAADAIGLGSISDPQVRARFEKYIGTKEVTQGELQAYAQGIQKVSALLRANKTFEAWRALQDLAAFQSIDAGVSQELANRIESIWNTDKASTHIDNDNSKLREEIKKADGNADIMSNAIRKQEIVLNRQETQGRPEGKNQRQPQNNGGVPHANQGDGSGLPSMPSMQGMDGRIQLTETYLQSLEAKARIKLNELKAQKLFEKAKSDFADYTQMLFKSGRHQHVILAADFYRRLFDEDEYPVRWRTR